MACHFTYRLEGSGIIFGTNNTAMTNTDGSEFNDSDYLSNDWATVFKKIKVDAAIKGLSNVAVVFETYFFDEQRPSDVPIEEYTIGDGGGHTLIGYNFSSKNFTITHFDSKVNPITKNPLTDYRFDSGAASINDFCTHAVRDLYTGYMDSLEARLTMQYLVSSMGGPKITLSGEKAYVGSAIPVNRLSEVPMDQLTKLLSITISWHIGLGLLMTLCTSSDSELGMCTVREVSLNDGVKVSTLSYDSTGAVTTSLMDTTATVSIDLNTIDDYWARRAKALKLKYYYL